MLILYEAAQEKNEYVFLVEFSGFYSINVNPMLIGGDFSIIRYSKENNKNVVVHKYTDTFN